MNFELRSMSRAEIRAMPDPSVLYDHVIEGKWGSLPNFLCPCCPHASLEREEVMRHLQLFHIAPVMKEQQQIQASPLALPEPEPEPEADPIQGEEY